MKGPGKYDDLCTEVRLKAKAALCMLAIVDGEKGVGFSVQCEPAYLAVLPGLLREMAESIEADIVSKGEI